MKIGVIGTGYVGLVTGACLANTGNRVTCMDKDPSQIEALQNGDIPIYEEGLETLVNRNRDRDRLFFTTDIDEAVAENDVIFIAVGTPQDDDGSADISNVLKVAEQIARRASDEKIVVCKSTVPIGTCDEVKAVIEETNPQLSFSVVSNPEFLKEGTAVKDFQSPDRVVIGAYSDEAAQQVGELYKPFMRRSERIVYMEPRSAEMTKYASNSMLATKISFINEMANICDAVDADIEDVRKGMSLDERIGPHFIYPGVGYGGSCFPKDIRALAFLGDEKGEEARILNAVTSVNEDQKQRLYEHAKNRFDTLSDKTFAVWGLSFKPRTDDVREAPALTNIRRLCEAGASIKATDPEAIDNAREALSDLDNIEFYADDYEVLRGADGLFIFTEWEEFRNPEFGQMADLMERSIIFDGRNLFEPEDMRNTSFEYICIGRPIVEQ
jgi:UDPglucose 6-dehydrogenase